MRDVFEDLIVKQWWVYEADEAWPGQLYHGFNLLEGSAWVVVAVFVLVRHARHRNSRLEPWYGLAFFLFGLTDFQEAYRLESWLILAKGVILLAIFGLRRHLLSRYYPGRKSF